MKKIIILTGILLILFLLMNMFSVYRTILVSEVESNIQGGKIVTERELEIWGLRYNPIWWEAFR